MRFLVKVKPSTEHINRSIVDGTFASKMQRTLSDLKPEAAYFFEEDGARAALFIVDIQKASDITKIGEPFFHGTNAEVRFHPVMTPQDLMEVNLQELARKWSDA